MGNKEGEKLVHHEIFFNSTEKRSRRREDRQTQLSGKQVIPLIFCIIPRGPFLRTVCPNLVQVSPPTSCLNTTRLIHWPHSIGYCKVGISFFPLPFSVHQQMLCQLTTEQLAAIRLPRLCRHRNGQRASLK